jgi:hypothetical protein
MFLSVKGSAIAEPRPNPSKGQRRALDVLGALGAAAGLGLVVVLAALLSRRTAARSVVSPVPAAHGAVQRTPSLRARSRWASKLSHQPGQRRRPLILLAGGWLGGARHWRPMLQELAGRGQRAVALDLPGLGAACG